MSWVARQHRRLLDMTKDEDASDEGRLGGVRIGTAAPTAVESTTYGPLVVTVHDDDKANGQYSYGTGATPTAPPGADSQLNATLLLNLNAVDVRPHCFFPSSTSTFPISLLRPFCCEPGPVCVCVRVWGGERRGGGCVRVRS